MKSTTEQTIRKVKVAKILRTLKEIREWKAKKLVEFCLLLGVFLSAFVGWEIAQLNKIWNQLSNVNEREIKVHKKRRKNLNFYWFLPPPWFWWHFFLVSQVKVEFLYVRINLIASKSRIHNIKRKKEFTGLFNPHFIGALCPEWEHFNVTFPQKHSNIWGYSWMVMVMWMFIHLFVREKLLLCLLLKVNAWFNRTMNVQ